ncbi:hypothetical protein PHLGIDRAFT_119382 [Phlebiopsis gigantea 11061_1 CR5-6]|uniref:BTB domain-containing protein n=1 Tax=Phlebiopsis gigantea (strain 11061_1 CR5-6) TaxID=745531 RepID=A0A0C3NLR0_PHLG1|nr:hypothetical protein PHLGIDRAFT_119382 [Phlebiopsis gigantea 11061_1 CR5-6]
MPSTFVVEYTSTVPCKADAPFESDPIADVVIRKSDNVEFSLVRGVLQVASSFRAMFALTQPDPVIKDTAMLKKVLEAAMKYEMSEAVDILQTRLRGFIQASPRSVYAVECRLELEEEARMAATEWKMASSLWLHDIFPRGFASSVAGGSYAPNMATITSGAYFRLLQYVRVAL